jgi:Histidine kinase
MPPETGFVASYGHRRAPVLSLKAMPSSNVRPIDEPLPTDVWAAGLGRFGGYRRYPSYTWPWFKRRAAAVWPLAVGYGMFLGMWHSGSMALWGEAIPLGSYAALGALVTVSAGPLAAMFVRYRRLPHVLEAGLVVAAVIGGVVLSHLMHELVASYHDALMQNHHGRSMHTPPAVESASHMIGVLMGELPYWLALFLCGGGWELKSYFSERRLLGEYDRRKDLDTLRRDKADSDLRLAVLQAQIEPHFLFNTLASIRTLVPSDPARATATINALASYLRTTLPKLRNEELHSATLGEQLDICSSYLDLMKVRIGDRLRVVIDVADELRAKEFPPLLLVPLVENAVKHGVEPQARTVTIAIRARVVDGSFGKSLQVDVDDDGAGLGEFVGLGVGLANVREQLQHRFGDGAILAVDSLPGGGVRSRISLPPKLA